MSRQTHTTKLIVRETKIISSGHTRTGSPYTMWQVIATREDGRPIEENLRSFEELPINVAIEVTVERFESDQYGVSFTLKLTGDSKAEHSVRNLVTRLTERVEALEREIVKLRPPADPSGPAPAIPQGTAPGPGDDDIPF